MLFKRNRKKRYLNETVKKREKKLKTAKKQGKSRVLRVKEKHVYVEVICVLFR